MLFDTAKDTGKSMLAGALGSIALALWLPAHGSQYVSNSGSDEHPYDSWEKAAHSIQDAINASSEKTVYVAPGEYVGNVTLPARMRVYQARGYSADPRACVIHGVPCAEAAGSPVVRLGADAKLLAVTVVAQDCSIAVACEGGVLHRSVVVGGDIGVDADDGFIDACTVLGNDVGMYVSGVTVVYDTVVAGNYQGIYGIGDTGYCLLVHCTVSGNDRGLCNLDTMLVSMRDCVVWGNGEWDGAWDPVGSDVGYPSLAGLNGNISADPLFVGWGDFNDSDYPIYVDFSNSGEEDGTKEHPFRTIGAALRAYDFHLSAGSPCIGAASDGLNMGAFPYDTPLRSPGPHSVRIRVAPGVYEEGSLLLTQGERLEGPGPRLATVAPGRHVHAASLRGKSAIEGFFILVDQASAVFAGPAATVANCVITTRGLAPWTPSEVGIAADGRILNCLIYGMPHAVRGAADIVNCTFTQISQEPLLFDPNAAPMITNTVLWDNGAGALTLPRENVSYSLVSDPALAGINGNIFADPRFVNPENGDFRLMGTSPCIDAGDNSSPFLPRTEIAGMRRIMYGGKSFTVDMGAYEYYINELKPGPGRQETTLTWSSLPDKTYSIFYSDELLAWVLADGAVPSAGFETTSWIDDGSKTGIAPSLVPRRFYRILENP